FPDFYDNNSGQKYDAKEVRNIFTKPGVRLGGYDEQDFARSVVEPTFGADCAIPAGSVAMRAMASPSLGMVALEPLLLPLARRHYAFAHLGRLFAGAFGRDFTELHRRHLDVQINAVQQRPRDAAQVVLDWGSSRRGNQSGLGHAGPCESSSNNLGPGCEQPYQVNAPRGGQRPPPKASSCPKQ